MTPASDVTYTVTIRRNADGAVRDCPQTLPWRVYEDGTDNIHWWTEGNMGCDCNRALEFARAADEEEEETPCGESAYTILKFTLADGRIVVPDEASR